MLKDFLNDKNISIYSLSKKTNIPYSTLNDLCNGKVEIDNCKVGMIINLANILDIPFEKLYDICSNKDNTIYNEEFDINASIKVKNKSYYIQYNDGNHTKEINIFKVNNNNNKYVNDAAKWLLEDSLIDSKMEEIYALQLNEKR